VPENLFCLYRLPRKEVNGLHCLFGDVLRKANVALFTLRFTLSSMQEIQYSNLRRAFSRIKRGGVRETKRRDLR